MEEFHQALIGVRAYSNDGIGIFKKTLKSLVDQGIELLAVSSVYKIQRDLNETKNIHNIRNQRSFEGLSVAVKVSTRRIPEELLNILMQLEKKLKNEVLHRSVSINLLIFGDYTLMTPRLTLPHPEFHCRPEDLIPAAEIWGDYKHPVLKQSLMSLARSLGQEEWGEFFAQSKSVLDF